MATLKITQVRSTNERSQRQRRTLTALGLRRIRHSVEHNDTPQIRGMIRTVQHLVDVETIESSTEDPEEATPEEATPEEAVAEEAAAEEAVAEEATTKTVAEEADAADGA